MGISEIESLKRENAVLRNSLESIVDGRAAILALVRGEDVPCDGWMVELEKALNERLAHQGARINFLNKRNNALQEIYGDALTHVTQLKQSMRNMAETIYYEFRTLESETVDDYLPKSYYIDLTTTAKHRAVELNTAAMNNILAGKSRNGDLK